MRVKLNEIFDIDEMKSDACTRSRHPQYPNASLQQGLHDLCLLPFEYLLQVPANRIGFTVMSVGQLKVLQEVITLTVFVPFAVYYLKEPLKLDYLWAGLCLLGAVFFIFREKLMA